MEGHHLHHHHNTNHDGYGSLADLRQLMNGRPTTHHHFPTIPQAAAAVELFPGHPNITPQGHGHHYEMLMLGRHHHQVTDLMPRGLQDFNNSGATGNNHTTAATSVNTTTGVSTPSFSGLDGDGGCSYGGDGGTGRWPRQETLTLLEIRSRLDSKFKEANQKGPLWDEVSRIMSEEHGYQRSGKKCREKFENLYKYYKKTKDGKAGRQDGKNYRFFRQLEALYGDNNNNNNSNTSVSLADHQTQHLVGTTSTNTGLPFHHHTATNSTIQDPCFNASHKLCDSLSLSNSSEFESTSSDDNVLGSHTENESSEKIKRKKKGGRNWKLKIKEFIDMQMRKLVERQEAWLEKLTNTIEKKEQERISREEEWRRQEEARIDREHEFWAKERAKIEARDAALMEALRNINGGGKQGHDVISNKKRKENSRNCEYFESNESLYNQSGRAYGEIHEEEVERVRIQGNNDGSSPSNSNVGNPVNDSCLRFFMADGETNLWENYGLKLNKGEN